MSHIAELQSVDGSARKGYVPCSRGVLGNRIIAAMLAAMGGLIGAESSATADMVPLETLGMKLDPNNVEVMGPDASPSNTVLPLSNGGSALVQFSRVLGFPIVGPIVAQIPFVEAVHYEMWLLVASAADPQDGLRPVRLVAWYGQSSGVADPASVSALQLSTGPNLPNSPARMIREIFFPTTASRSGSTNTSSSNKTPSSS
jgi:hypothetical protein